jgi:hypothetical protein
VDPNVVLPLLSSALSFAFAAVVFAQWLARRRSFQLVWTVGLLWYGISAGTEFLGSAFGWNEPLYRAWYLGGAFYVAAWLGMGTVYLLGRTRFGYFVAASFVVGGLFTLAVAGKYDAAVTSTLGFAASLAAAVAVAYATWRHRDWSAHLVLAILVLGSIIAAGLVLTATLAPPGYALDPTTRVPIGEAIPLAIRPLPIPFNIVGAFALVFGALFSMYVYMPKRKVWPWRVRVPVLAQLNACAAVVVNLVASLPGACVALLRGELHSRVPATLLIALGGFIPGVTSGLARFGITWSFFLGELIGVVLIFAGFILSTEVFGERLRVGPRQIVRREPSATRAA